MAKIEMPMDQGLEGISRDVIINVNSSDLYARLRDAYMRRLKHYSQFSPKKEKAFAEAIVIMDELIAGELKEKFVPVEIDDGHRGGGGGGGDE